MAGSSFQGFFAWIKAPLSKGEPRCTLRRTPLL